MRKMINRKGSTLALTIIIFAVLMIFATFTLGFMVTENKQAMYHQNKVKAYYAARSGAEIAEAGMINYIEQFVSVKQWDEIDNFITDLETSTPKLNIAEGGPVEGLNEVIISIEKLENPDSTKRDAVRIDSSASYGNVDQTVTKLLYFEAVRTNLDVSKKGGAPIIVTGGAWVENTNGSDNLLEVNDKYNLTFAEEIEVGNSLYPDYDFPPQNEHLVSFFSWSIPSDMEESEVSDAVETDLLLVSTDSYYNNLTVNDMSISSGIDLNIKGNLVINGDILLSDNANIFVGGSIILNGGSSLQLGVGSKVITNVDLTASGNTSIVFNSDEIINIGGDLRINSGSILNFTGDSTLNIGKNFIVNGEIINSGYSKAFIHGYMRINNTATGFNDTQTDMPDTMEIHIYNSTNDIIVDSHALIIEKTDGIDESIVGNFFIKKGKVRVSLKQTYFYGNIISNEVYVGEATYEDLSTNQTDYTVNVTTSNSNYAVYFKGSVYAKEGYVLLGGGTDASDKGALGQTGIIVTKYALVEGNNEVHNYNYMLDLYDNLQSNTITIPVETNLLSTIQSLKFISNYVN